MADERIERSLDALRREIAALGEADADQRERLETLVAEIERGVSDAGEERRESLIEEVQGAIEHFEVEHPRATAILNDIMVTLANMGI